MTIGTLRGSTETCTGVRPSSPDPACPNAPANCTVFIYLFVVRQSIYSSDERGPKTTHSESNLGGNITLFKIEW
jgi:hypothetical protein